MEQQNPLPDPSAEPSSPAPAGPAAAPGVNRRALLRGSAAVSPILLTLASGPVAATGQCVVASSFVSASVYKSRNPGASSIACISTTVTTLCNQAKSASWATCSSTAPFHRPVSYYVSGTVQCAGAVAFTQASKCYHVLRNSSSDFANQGTGLVGSETDIAVLQRLIALGHGAGGVFTPAYCQQAWGAWKNEANRATFVRDGGTGIWTNKRFLAWLDYSANNINLPA